MYDVAIVGAGTAGLTAALVLGRARRRTLVLDGGSPRNAPALAAHGVFTRDGTPPLELLRLGREQLRPYDSVQLRPATVTTIERSTHGLQLHLAGGGAVAARKVLLAHGVRDELPDIAGFRELWGTSVVHCPYCHGWEVRDEPLAVYARGQAAVHLTRLLAGWSSDLVLLADGDAELSRTERELFARHGVAIREERIARLDREGATLKQVVFEDGSTLARRAIFLKPPQRLTVELCKDCELTPEGHLVIDPVGRTTVSGIYAAGDIVTPAQWVSRAAASGAMAAAGINNELALDSFV